MSGAEAPLRVATAEGARLAHGPRSPVAGEGSEAPAGFDTASPSRRLRLPRRQPFRSAGSSRGATLRGPAACRAAPPLPANWAAGRVPEHSSHASRAGRTPSARLRARTCRPPSFHAASGVASFRGAAAQAQSASRAFAAATAWASARRARVRKLSPERSRKHETEPWRASPMLAAWTATVWTAPAVWTAPVWTAPAVWTAPSLRREPWRQLEEDARTQTPCWARWERAEALSSSRPCAYLLLTVSLGRTRGQMFPPRIMAPRL